MQEGRDKEDEHSLSESHLNNENELEDEFSQYSAGTEQSDDGDVSVLDANAISDQDNMMDLIHEWLFSEDVPHFNKSDVLKNIISNDTDFKILFKLMLQPFSFKLHLKAIMKYRKMTNNLKIELKATLPRNESFMYRPDKHNPFYLRARRMMIIF